MKDLLSLLQNPVLVTRHPRSVQDIAYEPIALVQDMAIALSIVLSAYPDGSLIYVGQEYHGASFRPLEVTDAWLLEKITTWENPHRHHQYFLRIEDRRVIELAGEFGGSTIVIREVGSDDTELYGDGAWIEHVRLEGLLFGPCRVESGKLVKVEAE